MTLTKHAEIRMTERIITLQDVYNCIAFGTLSTTREGHKKYTDKMINVVLDANTNTVITCFYISKINHKIEKILRKSKNKINKRQAIMIVRGDLIVSTI